METKCCIYILEMSAYIMFIYLFSYCLYAKGNFKYSSVQNTIQSFISIGHCLVLGINKAESLNHFKRSTANMFIQAHD